MIKKERRQQHGASLLPYSVISPFFFPSTFFPSVSHFTVFLFAHFLSISLPPPPSLTIPPLLFLVNT